MIRRSMRVNFRLTPAEVDAFEPLIKALHCYNWSELVRRALRDLAEAHPVERASDNGVRHSRSTVSDTFPLLDVRKKKPAKKKKRKKLAKSA